MLVRPESTMGGTTKKDYLLPHFAFVDADNLRRTFFDKLSDLEVPERFHHRFIFSKLLEVRSHDRVYVYSAISEGSDLPDWLKTIRSQKGIVLKLGTLTQKGQQRKQEGVDVKLAIDATRFAFSRTMRTCTLYGADGDFIPLVEAVSESGCIVEVASFNNPEKGRVAPSLQAGADNYIRLNGPWLDFTQRGNGASISNAMSLYHQFLRTPIHKKEKIHGEAVEIKNLGSSFYAQVGGDSPSNVVSCSDYDDLLIWLKLNFEAV